MIDVTLLGTGGMLPLPQRWLSSVLLGVNGERVLFDCGEGTQITWRERGLGFRSLAAICITHTHADHIAGLPGLLHTVANSGRIEPIALFGPAGTANVVCGLRAIAPHLPFSLSVTELDGGESFGLPGGLVGSCAAGEHGLPVLGYRVDLARKPRFLPERANTLGVPVSLWRRLQEGERVTVNGIAIDPAQVLGPPRRGLSVAYITDTRPTAALTELVNGVDLLVCEGTYGDDADGEKAKTNRHMTFREAARLASGAEVSRLWITHFSPSVLNPSVFIQNATEEFAGAVIGYDGLAATLTFSED